MHSVGRGVTRSKKLNMSWMRKAAENGHIQSCSLLAARMYGDCPYAREVGYVGVVQGTAEVDYTTSACAIGMMMLATGFLGSWPAVWECCWGVAGGCKLTL